MTYQHVKQARNKKRIALQALKEGQGCSQCGESFPHYCLDWHHVDRTDKLFSISLVVRDNISWKRVNDEITKCILLCKNCHAIIEWKFNLHGPPGRGSLSDT
jgi:hypothetical protein